MTNHHQYKFGVAWNNNLEGRRKKNKIADVVIMVVALAAFVGVVYLADVVGRMNW